MADTPRFERIKVEFNGFVHDLDPESYLRIDRSDLRGELIRQPENYAQIGYISACAEAKMNTLEAKMKRVESNTFINTLEAGTKETGKKPSDEVLKHLVRSDPSVNAVLEEYIEAKRMYEYLCNVSRAMYGRFDTLKNLVSLERGELAAIGGMNNNPKAE